MLRASFETSQIECASRSVCGSKCSSSARVLHDERWRREQVVAVASGACAARPPKCTAAGCSRYEDGDEDPVWSGDPTQRAAGVGQASTSAGERPASASAPPLLEPPARAVTRPTLGRTPQGCEAVPWAPGAQSCSCIEAQSRFSWEAQSRFAGEAQSRFWMEAQSRSSGEAQSRFSDAPTKTG